MGFNGMCVEDGICSQLQPPPRCDKFFPEDLFSNPTRYPDVLLVGTLMDRSVEREQARLDAIELATEQVNLEGGILGRPLGMVFCDVRADTSFDTATKTEAAIANARFLSDELGVQAIIGPSGSSDTLAVFNALKGSGTLLISPSATSNELTAAEPIPASDAAPGLLWRTAPPDSAQSELIVQDMEARLITTVALFYKEDAYGEGLATLFQEEFTGTVEARSFSTQNGRDEAIAELPLLTAVQEVLFISADADDVKFMLASANNMGVMEKTIFLTDSGASTEVLSAITSADILPRVRGTRPRPLGMADFVYQLFVTAYTPRYGDPSAHSFTPHAYDAAWLVFAGMARSVQQEQTLSGVGIARGMRMLSQGNAIDLRPSNWTDIVDRLGEGDSINITGASGALDYSSDEEETTGEVEVWIPTGEIGMLSIIPAP